MMNRLFFFVIFNFTNNLYSQSLSSNVLANSGDFVVNENSVSSTIGESLVFTNSQNNYFLYQGFQNTAIIVNDNSFFRILTYRWMELLVNVFISKRSRNVRFT